MVPAAFRKNLAYSELTMNLRFFIIVSTRGIYVIIIPRSLSHSGGGKTYSRVQAVYGKITGRTNLSLRKVIQGTGLQNGELNIMLLNTKVHFFIQVAETGSFTSAAKKLYITPTAVMKQIDLLEDELGFRLLERTRRGVTLTSAGESLYNDVEQLKQLVDEAVQRAKIIEKTNSHMLRIGISLLFPCNPDLLRLPRLKEIHPDFQIQLVPIEEDRYQVAHNLSLLGKDIDFIMSPLDSISCSSQCQFFQLDSCSFCVTVPLSHRLARLTSLSYQDLHGERLMLPPHGDHLIFDQVRNQIEKEHPQIHIVNGPLYHDLKLYNQCELTNTLLLTTSNTPDLQPSLKSIPLDNSLTIPYGLMYAQKPREIAKRFLEYLAESN